MNALVFLSICGCRSEGHFKITEKGRERERERERERKTVKRGGKKK